jgi:SWIM zinc finger
MLRQKSFRQGVSAVYHFSCNRQTKGKDTMHDNGRELRGLEIAAKARLKQDGDRWFVPSQSGGGTNHGGKYIVQPDVSNPHCTCPDFETRQLKCKHIWAVEFTVQREYTSDGETQTLTETVTVKKTYKQEWSAYNAAQVNEKDQFQSLLRELCKGIGEPSPHNDSNGNSACTITLGFQWPCRLLAQLAGPICSQDPCSVD